MEYEDLKKTYGSWNFSVYQTTSKTRALLNENVLIDEIGTMTIYGTINSEAFNEYNYIGSLDDSGIDLTRLTFEAGAAPNEPNEIALEKNLLLKLGFDSTIGSPITVTYTNILGETEHLNFTLCGIVNSYHNTYLKQGPLVTAFVCNTFHSSIKYTEYINTFIKLNDAFHSQAIMNEIKNGSTVSATHPEETWYYNSYIEKSMELPYRPIICMLATSLLLVVALYHSFLFYFKNRYKVLMYSQLMGMNKKTILRIHLQESGLCITSSFFAGTILSGLAILLFYGSSKLIHSSIPLHMNYRLLGYSILFTLLSLLFGILGPCLHCFLVFDQIPKQKLPIASDPFSPKKYKKNTFILFRLIKVYKSKALYFLLCNMCTILLLSILGVSSNYLYKNLAHVETEHIIDYTIGVSPFSPATLNKKEQVSSSVLDKISQLDEVHDIIKYRYASTASLTLIEFPEQESYNYDTTTQTKKLISKYHLFKELDEESMDSCILYIPKQNESSNSYLYKHNKPRIGDTIRFDYQNNTYELKVVGIMQENEFEMLTNKEPCTMPCIFTNSNTYEYITYSSDQEYFDYASIIYNDITECSVTTNIIDTILFSEPNVTTNHLNTENKNIAQVLTKKLTLHLIFTIFIILLSVALQDSQRSMAEDYLEYHVHVLWYLGLSKKEIIKLYVKFYCYLISLSLTIAMILTILYYLLFYRPNFSLVPFAPAVLVAWPGCFYFCIFFIFCYLTLYFSKSYKYIHKMINSF
ncbi:MAG: hypothetical protein Q4G58_12080 [bacterium]|nr:hypothetical protein [bacterium]